MRLMLIIAIPFFGALLPMLLARAGRRACAIATGLSTLMALVLLLSHAPVISAGQAIAVSHHWVPQVGMDLALRLDGLGLLMAGLILGIGLLIVIYAYHYLGEDESLGAFFTYLLLFQGSMVGIALADNLLSLLVFWEGTSLASFLLIGFWRHLAEGRRGARMALIVTGGGGLALIAGMLLLGDIAGTMTISELIAQREAIQQSPRYPLALLLIAVGCFTKSAQFPFHFWLPQAMAAPTPVSAYLHSATMVKAGVFLLARLWLVLAGTEWWFYTIASVGAVTFLVGSVVALFQDDLKALLAYSTISHLGLMTMLLGLGTEAGLIAALLHLLNHAAFKGALFLTFGIIDHETGSRDLRKLGGLWRALPITGGIALLGLAANAGLPPLGGFLSKEMMLEAVSHVSWWGQAHLLTAIAAIAGTFAVAYSARFFVGAFLGKPGEDLETPYGPGWGLAGPAALLVLFALAFGVFAQPLAEPILQTAVRGAMGNGDAPTIHLKLWHGVNLPLILSGVAIVAGSILAGTFRVWRPLLERLPTIEGQRVFQACEGRLVSVSRLLSERFHDGSLAHYLTWSLVGVVTLGGLSIWSFGLRSGDRPLLPINVLALLMVALLAAACLMTILLHRRLLLSVLTANVVGLVTSIGFIYFSAPDLALTQISVEVVTLILILLALYFLPKETVVEASPMQRWRDAVLAGLCGLAMFALTWAVLSSDGPTDLANYLIEQSKPAGGGSNVVNVILVDFRGFDTFNEIMVLAISALIIYALLDGAMHGAAADKLDHWEHDMPRSPEKHPAMFISFTRALLPLALLVGVYMFLRGHNQPGGGFVAGLVVTIALIVQYMVSGYQWAAERISIDYHSWIGWGILLAAGTGVASMILGYPFLTNAHEHFDLPYLGSLDISSALVFDLGVLMTVVGAVMLALANLSRLGRRAERAAQKAAEAAKMLDRGE